jgi:hypothetical protein
MELYGYRPMKIRILQGSVMSLVVALVMAEGCTEPPLGWMGAGRNLELPPPAEDASGVNDGETGVATLPGLCASPGVICNSNADCCDGDCDPKTGSCGGTESPPYCAPNGVVCVRSTDCCHPPDLSEGFCGGGVCGATPPPVCVPEYVYCTDSMDCCNNSGSEAGTGGVICGPNHSCCGIQEPCTDKQPPLCVPFGVDCHQDSDCCAGFKCSLNMNEETVCDIPPS